MKAAQITPERAPFAPQFPQHLPAGLVRAGVRRGFPLEPLRGVGHWHCPGACADTRTRGSAAAAPPAASADPGGAPAPAVSQPYLAAVPGPAPAAAACACGDSPAAPLPCVSGASLPLLPLVPPPLLLGIQQDRDVSRFLEFQLLLVTENYTVHCPLSDPQRVSPLFLQHGPRVGTQPASHCHTAQPLWTGRAPSGRGSSARHRDHPKPRRSSRLGNAPAWPPCSSQGKEMGDPSPLSSAALTSLAITSPQAVLSTAPLWLRSPML